MSSRITMAQAIRMAGNQNRLAKELDVSRAYIGELYRGTEKQRKKRFLPKKYADILRENRLPARSTRKK